VPKNAFADELRKSLLENKKDEAGAEEIWNDLPRGGKFQKKQTKVPKKSYQFCQPGYIIRFDETGLLY